MMLCSQLSLSKPLQDHLVTRDWSMGTMVTNREYRESLKGVTKTIIAPFEPKMRNNRGVLCCVSISLDIETFLDRSTLGLYISSGHTVRGLKSQFSTEYNILMRMYL